MWRSIINICDIVLILIHFWIHLYVIKYLWASETQIYLGKQGFNNVYDKEKNIIGYFICPLLFWLSSKKRGHQQKKNIYIFSLLSKNCYPRISRCLTIYTSRSVTDTYLLLYIYIYVYTYIYIHIDI